VTALLLLAPGSAHATFPGQNGKIAFVGVTESLRPCCREIYTMNSDGSVVTPLGNPRAHPKPTDPSFSPNGRKLAYSTYFKHGTEDGWRIATMRPDGSDKIRLTAPGDRTFDLNPSYAPDGRRIVFERQDYSDPYGPRIPVRIMIRNRNGEVRALASFRMSAAWGRQMEPIFSLDGKRIVFVHPGGQESDIWVMRADGRNPRPLVTGPGTEAYPDFSPDGRRITFSRTDASGTEIYLARSSGSDAVNLTPDSEINFLDPTFSPDGTKILYSTGSGLELMNPDGSGRAPLSYDSDLSKGDPSWQPVRAGKH
jgi:TolB protein